MAEILNAIMEDLETQIIADCQTAVDPSNPSRLTTTEIAEKLKADPEENSPFVLIHPDRRGEEGISRRWPSRLVQEFIGGGGKGIWEHSIVVHLGWWMTGSGYDRDTARQNFGEARNRLLSSLRDHNVSVTSDDGESTFKTTVHEGRVEERGGPDTEWIWEQDYLVTVQSIK